MFPVDPTERDDDNEEYRISITLDPDMYTPDLDNPERAEEMGRIMRGDVTPR